MPFRFHTKALNLLNIAEKKSRENTEVKFRRPQTFEKINHFFFDTTNHGLRTPNEGINQRYL